MEQVKIYLQAKDLKQFAAGKKPTQYWLYRPFNVADLVEVTIPITRLQEWTNAQKSLLFD